MKIKNLISLNYQPIIIHHQEWSATKGVTGKIDFILNKVNSYIESN